MNKLSVVLPAYNEELMVGKTCRVLAQVLTEAQIPYELVVVNDGSSDRTWEEIQKAGERDANVTGVLFSRNFGKEAAIFAGLAQAGGDVVAVMDCDLQHPPQTLIEMYRLWQDGYEVIEGVKSDRGKEGFLHKECAGFFYDIMSKATKVNMKDASDFKMLDRKAVDSILSMPERNMFFRATSTWVGYKTTSVEFEVQEREAGVSKWSPWTLVKYAFTNIVSIAVCYYYRSGLFYMFAGPYDLFADTVFRRFCSGGIYDTADGTAAGGKRHDDQSGDHWILYCQDL